MTTICATLAALVCLKLLPGVKFRYYLLKFDALTNMIVYGTMGRILPQG